MDETEKDPSDQGDDGAPTDPGGTAQEPQGDETPTETPSGGDSAG